MSETLQQSSLAQRARTPGNGRVTPCGSERTRQQLLDAAERLMADRGIEAVSLREIATAASARNSSAAQYHFGTKEHLVEAVLSRHMGTINERRLYILASTRGGRHGDGFWPLVVAWVVPLVEHVGDEPGSSWYARFLSRYIASRGLAPTVATLQSEVTSGIRLVFDEIDERLAHMPRSEHMPQAERHRRIRLGNTIGIHALADFERDRDAGRTWSGGRSALAGAIVSAIVAVLEAPAPEDIVLPLDIGTTGEGEHRQPSSRNQAPKGRRQTGAALADGKSSERSRSLAVGKSSKRSKRSSR